MGLQWNWGVMDECICVCILALESSDNVALSHLCLETPKMGFTETPFETREESWGLVLHLYNLPLVEEIL